MKKSSKGALAAAVAAVLLLGGAGSLAYWNATDEIPGGEIDSGRLALIEGETNAWQLNGAPVADPTAVVLVPGDELTYSGTYEIDAAGDNLEATVAVTGAATAGTLADDVTTTTSFTLEGTALDGTETIDESNDGDELGVSIVIDFPFGTTVDNTSQSSTLDLSAITVTLTQTDATP